MQSMKAHAKINIFLKITGHKDGYHTLLSRFVKVENLYDNITIAPCQCEHFTLEGCEGIALESNTIYKAYQVLQKHISNPHLEEFFMLHKVIVTKNIPSGAGLGGGSSDAAAFMRLTNQLCNLRLTTEELAQIGSTVGADIPFFIYDYNAANIRGFGEIVEPFEEEPLKLEIYTPPMTCDTTVVYKTFKQHFLKDINSAIFDGWEQKRSVEILATIQDPILLNDLYRAALKRYPKLLEYVKEGWFFSGSGSSFFRVI